MSVQAVTVTTTPSWQIGPIKVNIDLNFHFKLFLLKRSTPDFTLACMSTSAVVEVTLFVKPSAFCHIISVVDSCFESQCVLVLYYDLLQILKQSAEFQTQFTK